MITLIVLIIVSFLLTGYHNQQHQIPTIYTINTQTNVNRTQEQIAYDELMIQHAAEIESYKMAQQRNKYCKFLVLVFHLMTVLLRVIECNCCYLNGI